MHMAPASSQAQDPFLLQPADLEASMRTRPAEPQEQGGARGLLTHLQQGRPFGAALNQEIFEEDEEEEESPGTPRGRRPPVFESKYVACVMQGLVSLYSYCILSIFHDQPDGETHTATPSPSRSSHSRSPPQDLTQHTIAPCSPTSSEISSSTRGQFDVEGLRLGGGPTTTTTSHMATGLIGALLDGFKTLFTLGFRRNVNRLDRKQRALWLWVNVDDLDSFLADVSLATVFSAKLTVVLVVQIYGYYAGKGIYCIALAKLINLM